MKKPSKQVKVIATIGPASNSMDIILKLIHKGASVFRLNFSHGDHATHGESIANIRAAAQAAQCEVAIMADLQGPKIRTRETENNRVLRLEIGSSVLITAKDRLCTETLIAIDYPALADEIAIGQKILINDGDIQLTVTAKNNDGDLLALVTDGGVCSSHKGVNLPHAHLSTPSLTKKDLDDLSFILKQDVQYIALSFVRKADDIDLLRSIVHQERNDIKIIAKIEKPEATGLIDQILAVCDGIMIARGDLGIEASVSATPVLQKELIFKANTSGKLVIVATQMLESMISNPMPTRAEATDIANAIIDGTDAIMLSGETAIGSYPVETVETMVTIAQATEMSRFINREKINLTEIEQSPPNAICKAAVRAGREMGGIPMCVYTISGETALYCSKIRYHDAPIFAFSPNIQVVRMLALAWNIEAFHLPFTQDIALLHNKGEQLLITQNKVRQGDFIVIVSGTNPNPGVTNIVRIHRTGMPN